MFNIRLHDRLILYVQAKQDRVAELLVAASPAGKFHDKLDCSFFDHGTDIVEHILQRVNII